MLCYPKEGCPLSVARQAPKVTSGGTKKAVASWADSDTESEAGTAAPPPKKRDAFGESESESESESEAEHQDSEVRGWHVQPLFCSHVVICCAALYTGRPAGRGLASLANMCVFASEMKHLHAQSVME